MNLRFSSACVAVLICCFQCHAFGQTSPAEPSPPPSATPSSESSTPDPAPPPSTVAEAPKANEVPKLALRWDCGDCTQNVKVLPLIEEEYAKEALAKGYAVSATEVAELSITEYRQRPPGARVMFGFLAGRDILKTKIVFRGKEFVAEDYSANAWLGMNSLCASVAQQAVKQLSPSSSPQ